MSLLNLAYIIARRRIVSAWRLELVLFLGIMLSVSLLSSGVVFSDLLAEAALRRAMRQATPEEANLLVRVFNDLDAPRIQGRTSSYQKGMDFMAWRFQPQFERFLAGRSHLLETSTFFYSGHPQLELPNNRRPRGKIQYMSGLVDSPYAELVDGRWPRGPGAGGDPRSLEVALDQLGAELLQLGVGDTMGAFPASTIETPKTAEIKIVGVFRRIDPGGDYWYAKDRGFSYQNEQWTIVPLLTAEETILEQVGSIYPGIYTNVTWIYNLDRRGIRAGDVTSLQETIRRTRYDVAHNLENSSINIRLDRVLTRYTEQLVLARIPLFLMLFLVTGILAYYLVLVASLTVRSRAPEIAMLKSRGSTTPQIGMLVLVEGLVLAVPAIIVGSLLSPVVARLLGGLFFQIEGDVTPVALSGRAFLLGAGGALLAVAVLTVSTLVAARQGIVEFRQSGARPPRAPFLHRYYIDILMLFFIGVIWWQIKSRDTFLIRPLTSGELEIDFTLLLGPVLGLLALGLLVLRLFPIFASLLARIAETVGPAWLVQGLRRVSRDPIVPGSLVVLLMLATALGVIGSAFSSTLDRSQRDRSQYEAGADLRLLHTGDSGRTLTLGLSELVEELPEVDQAAEVQRINGQLLTQNFGTTRLEVLAVDTERFDRVAWYRGDFAGGRSLEELVAVIEPRGTLAPSNAGNGPESSYQADGIRLPGNASFLSLWVHSNRPGARLAWEARLRDGRGQYFDVLLGDLDDRGWHRLQGEIVPIPPRGRSSGTVEPVTPPYDILGLQLIGRTGINEPGTLFLGGLTVGTPAGEQTITDFTTLDGWHFVEDYGQPGLYSLDISQSVVREGSGGSAVYSWSPGGRGLRGLWAGRPEQPLPAIVSPEVLELADVAPGDELSLGMSTFTVPIRVVAVADYFPTLDPRENPFVVLDLSGLNHYGNRHNRRLVGGSNELWASLNGEPPGTDQLADSLEAVGLQLKETYLATDLVDQRVEQPLANAGWGGLLVLMFLSLVLANASGVVLFSYMDTRERQTEFALLRTLGSSKSQLNGVAWFTLLVVVVCGIGLGTWAGQQIGAGLLPVLEVAEGGVRVTPPMVLQTNWTTLLVSYAVLAAVSVGTVVWLAWLTAKMEVHQVLRAGEAGV